VNAGQLTPVPRAVTTTAAPAPAGPYSQAIRIGSFVFLAGQTPRQPTGMRLLNHPLEAQARQALDNLEAIARASGGSLRDAVKVTVYLRPGVHLQTFNQIYQSYFSDPLPARTTIVSDLPGGAVEVDAVLWCPPAASLP